MKINYVKHKTNPIIKQEISYKATGTVIGIVWAGYEATYPIKELTGSSLKDIKIQAEARIANNTLTGTGDFQKLLGAQLVVTCITKLVIKDREFINDKDFINEQRNILVVGKLNEEQIEDLEESFFNNL